MTIKYVKILVGMCERLLTQENKTTLPISRHRYKTRKKISYNNSNNNLFTYLFIEMRSSFDQQERPIKTYTYFVVMI